MPDQVLRVVPNGKLVFMGPFNTRRGTILNLTNPTNERICFKLKTTAPRFYAVRPNSGVLKPGATLDIVGMYISYYFTLRAHEEDPPDPDGRHKIMVQAIPVLGTDIDMGRLWREVDPKVIMETKLRCLFEYPVTAETTPEEENNPRSNEVLRERNMDLVCVMQLVVAIAVALVGFAFGKFLINN